MADPIETAEITVQFVNEVKPGKKWGSVKSSEGNLYGCPPALLRQFSVGEVCKIEYAIAASGFKGINKKIGTSKGPPLSPPPRQRTNPVDNEHIFITACLKEFIAAGKVELITTEIVTAVATIRDAYRFTLGGLEKQRSDNLNDEVPY
jgi:hypothetical protein